MIHTEKWALFILLLIVAESYVQDSAMTSEYINNIVNEKITNDLKNANMHFWVG